MNTTDQDAIGTVGSGDTAGQQPSAERADEATGSEDGGDILTLVCFKCGTEYYFSEGSQPEEMTCGKCGNTVFRSFHSPADERDPEEYDEETHRDLRTDDPEGDALPGDLLDLDRV